MKSRKIIIFVLVAVLSLFAIANLVAAGGNRNLAEPPKYQVNKYGLTYGSGADAISAETEPDLISAIGVGGVEGYVYSKDLREDMPKTPEEAVAMMKAQEELLANSKPNEPVVIRTIPLYDIDGKTVIGEFQITNIKKSD